MLWTPLGGGGLSHRKLVLICEALQKMQVISLRCLFTEGWGPIEIQRWPQDDKLKDKTSIKTM